MEKQVREKNIEIYKKGIDNWEYFDSNFLPSSKEQNEKIRKATKIKLFLFIFANLTFGRKKNELGKTIISFTYANTHTTILKKQFKNKEVSWGRNINSIKKFNSSENLINYINKKNVIKEFIKNILRIKFNDIPCYLEFLILKDFINSNNLKKIVIAGHQDRQATWLSFLCKNKGVDFVISQHGILSSAGTKHKLYVNKVYVYNKFEGDFFKRFLVSNDNCIYKIKKMESTFNFKKNKSTDFSIGFFSQYGETENTKEICKKLKKDLSKEIKLYLYIHPRESKQKYKELEGIGIKVEKEKYYNLNIILTYRSTVIYDYKANENFSGKIIYYPKNFIHELAFKNIKNVFKVNNYKDMLKEIKGEVNEKK